MNEQNRKKEAKNKTETPVLKTYSHAFRLSENEEAKLNNLLKRRNNFFGNNLNMSDFLREQLLKSNKAYELKKMNITLETLVLELKQFNEYVSIYADNAKELFLAELLKTISADLKRAHSLYEEYLRKETRADFLAELLNSLSISVKEALTKFEEYEAKE